MDLALVEDIVSGVKSSVSVPVWAKLTPNTHALLSIAEAAEKADAYVLINTVRGMAIDIDARMPVLSNKYGGLSGPCIKPVGLRAVYEVKANIDKPIVGVGGIVSGRDALEYIMAGASAVELGTAVYYHGIEVFSKVAEEMRAWLLANKIENIAELVGSAQRR